MVTYLLIVIAYVVSGKAALMLALPPGYASAIFPPAGIAIAVAYIWGRQTLPWVFLGSLLLNFWTGYTAGHVISPTAIGAAFVIASASTIQAAFGGWILRRRIGFPAAFDRARQIFRYLAWSPIICLFSASLSVIGLAMLGVFDKGNLGISWLSWWAGDFLGFLTMFPVVMALAGEPRDLWKKRIKTVAVPMLLLLAAGVTLFLKANQWDQEENLNDFRQFSQQSLDQITLGLDEQTAIVMQLHGLFVHDANGVVTRQEFRRYCKDTLLKFPMIQAMEWAPKIPLSRRKAFELAQQKALPGFRITERNRAGKMQPAGKRDWYYPVTYMQPFTGNKAALGFDLASNRQRRQTVDTATASGTVVASGPINLVQHGAGILIIKSVSINGHAAGVVLTVLKMQNFMNAILPSTKRYLHLRLTDVESRRDLYDNFPSSLHRALYERTYEYGGRRYRLQTLPTASYYKDHRSWGSWGVLAIGALSTSLIGVLLLLGTGYTARVEAQVRERTIKLKESEERFRKTLEHSPIGMCIGRLDDRFLQVNQAYCSIVGYEKAELDKLNVRDITYPDDAQRDAELKQQLIEGKVNSYRIEKRYIRKDGQIIWVQVTASLETNADQVPEHFIVQVEDISERKKMERTVQDKLLELHTILDSASVAITFVKDRRQTWANKRMERLFGYTHEEIVDQSTRMFYRTEEEFEAFGEKAYPALLETGEYQTELEMRHRDGHSLWINISGKAIVPSDLSMGSIWVLEDITARKLTQDALNTSAKEIEDLYENAPCGYHSVNAEGVISKINQTELNWLGFERDELLGKNVKEIHSLASQLRLQDKLARLAHGEPIHDMEFELVRKDGSILPILLNATAIFDDHGNFLMSRSTILDMRDRKELEHKLEVQAHVDALTGLNNRGYFSELAEYELARAKRLNQSLGLMMLDIDYFKQFNDRYGHDAGDMVLKAFSETSKRTLREVDIIGRWGGEEFIVLLPGVDVANAMNAAERLRVALSNTIVPIEPRISESFTVSIGVAALLEPSENLDALVKRADNALYDAKHAGRNCVYPANI